MFFWVRFYILIIHHDKPVSSIHKYIHKFSSYVNKSANLIYPIVSFHGLALLPALFLAGAAAIGGVCCRGLWVKVCLSGPVGET